MGTVLIGFAVVLASLGMVGDIVAAIVLEPPRTSAQPLNVAQGSASISADLIAYAEEVLASPVEKKQIKLFGQVQTMFAKRLNTLKDGINIQTTLSHNS